MRLDIGREIKIIDGEKTHMGVIQRLFPSTDVVVSVRLTTGGLKSVKESEITENEDGLLVAVIEPEYVQQVTKKKGIFGLFRK